MIITLLLILSAGVGGGFPSFLISEVSASANVNDKGSGGLTRAEIENKLKAANTDLGKIQDKQKKAMKEIEKLNKSVTDVQQKIISRKKQVVETEEEVKVLQEEITRLEEQIEQRNDIVNSRIRTLHESGGVISYINVLVGANSFDEFLDRARAVSIIMEADQDILSNHQADWDALEESRSKLNNKIVLLQEMLNELQNLEKELKIKKEEQERSIVQMEENKEKIQNEIKVLQNEKSKLIENTVKIEQAKSTSVKIKKSSSNNSSFIWPTIGGVITSYQGMRWGAFHKGIDIAGPSDYSILAADSGEITFSGWRNGYGNTVIIDHNNGYRTQYAHLASYNVQAGDTVSQGNVIGIMGTTGRSTGIHLDFEVYKDGRLLNPMDVLPGR
ncbi:murein hydrolase activator EnvC family protein [Bacillus sp. PS06]|uniref:murein hydrolase activator EnvC family protein n=1 Tax=Bacillus sp. PS06 TaxID=2764176 RepID=UPI00296E3638|nr:peptidoglycan DD-metalloendopeptidase family protein [Bacillus sp. PS06]